MNGTVLRVCTCIVAAILVCTSISAQSSVPLLFQSGWEAGDLLDGGTWTAWGGTGGSIDATERRDGSRSLMVTFPPNGWVNGPAFRVAQENSQVAYQELWFRFWMKNSQNWVWGNNEHKLFIIQDSNFRQNIYVNVTADGVRGGTGRVSIANTVVDTNFRAANSDPIVTPGEWHLFEVHLVAGSNGRIEVKLDGRTLTLTSNPGSYNPLNVNTGANFRYWKVDTTYNDYAYPSSLGITMYRWYDSVAVSDQGWISSVPAAPTNLRLAS
jgi:hypothetical protein